MKGIRIGAGAGFSGDRIEPAVELVNSGALDYLVFESLSERTLPLAQQRKRADPSKGYDPFLEARMRAVLGGCARRKIKIVTNMGAANPQAAGEVVIRICRELNLPGVSVAIITGDDILEQVKQGEVQLEDSELCLDEVKGRLISANVYLGADPIVDALEAGADVVITGRVTDPSLFVGPIRYELGWPADHPDRMGLAVILGHLLECGAQITGGYFADPSYKDVEGLERLGYPILEVYEDGRSYVTKVPGTGGIVTVATCKEQLLYEIGDPANYISADGVASILEVTLKQVGPDRVQVLGAHGKPRPPRLRVIVGSLDGYFGEGEISYGGLGAYDRARLAAEAVKKRLELVRADLRELRVDFIGANSLYGKASPQLEHDPPEVRLRVCGLASDPRSAEMVGNEVENLLVNGPAAGGGVRERVREVIGLHSAFIRREAVQPRMEIRQWERSYETSTVT